MAEKLFEYFGKGKKRIINPQLLGPGVKRSDCIVGEKMPDGKWQGPHPWPGGGVIISSTPRDLRLAQKEECRHC